MVVLPKRETGQNGFFHLKLNTKNEEVGFRGSCCTVSLLTQLSLVACLLAAFSGVLA